MPTQFCFDRAAGTLVRCRDCDPEGGYCNRPEGEGCFVQALMDPKVKSYRFERRGTAYHLVLAVMQGSGNLLIALPDWHWCCTWPAMAPPPAAGWLAENGLQEADAVALADRLAMHWRDLA
jgi:hypothetical protein